MAKSTPPFRVVPVAPEAFDVQAALVPNVRPSTVSGEKDPETGLFRQEFIDGVPVWKMDAIVSFIPPVLYDHDRETPEVFQAAEARLQQFSSGEVMLPVKFTAPASDAPHVRPRTIYRFVGGQALLSHYVPAGGELKVALLFAGSTPLTAEQYAVYLERSSAVADARRAVVESIVAKSESAPLDGGAAADEPVNNSEPGRMVAED